MSDTSAVLYGGNYFAEGDYIQTDVRTGVMRNRAGTRMIGLTDDFLRGLVNALDAECGPAAPAVLKSCGKHWGKQYAGRFAREMEEFYGQPLEKFPLPMFLTMTAESFSHHGWGRLTLEMDRYDKGLIVVVVRHPVGAAVAGPSSKPADQLLAGVLAGMFSKLTGQDLDCLQTQCSACGAEDSRFVVTLGKRVAAVADWPAKGKPHAEVLAHLETTRA